MVDTSVQAAVALQPLIALREKEILMSDSIDIHAIDDEEYEEITSDEVDRVVEALEQLNASIDSENIRVNIENAASDIWYLVYDDEDVADAA